MKDALREGRLRKNYRFEVQKEVEQKDPVILATLTSENSSYTIPSDGTYILYNEGNNHAFDWVEITGSTSRAEFCPVGETETWLVISGTCYTDDVLTINNFNADAVYVTRSDLVVYTKAWEYDFTIDNDNLVSESVNIDERMCSGDKIKYGLCEGSSLEFQYFMPEKGQYEANKAYMHNDLVRSSNTTWRSKVDGNIGNPLVEGAYWTEWTKPNITGRQLKVFVDVEYGESTPYAIPMGYFSVKNCSRQASTGIIKAVCYNKLQSDYLDAKANSLIEGIQSDTVYPDKVTLETIQNLLLQDYEIKEKEVKAKKGGVGTTGGYLNDGPTFKMNGRSTTYYPYIVTQLLTFWHLDSTKRYKITVNDYLIKLKNCIESMKNTVMQDMQNPSTFWQNFLNYYPYQYYCVMTVIYGNGNSVNGFFCIEDEEPSIIYGTIENHGVLEKLEYLYGVSSISFRFPISFRGSTSSVTVQNDISVWYTDLRATLDDMKVEEIQTDTIESVAIPIQNLPDVTLRELVTANYELHCQFGQLDRETDLFSGVELNRSRLLPADTLYPDNALYPGGAAESAFRSQYSKLWADEGNVRKWRYLIITYKGLDENQQEKDFTLQRTVNADGTDDYNCSDNWLFRNLIWTAADIGTYADAMVLKMQDITWFPFEMWCAGLPYLETGDEIEIPLGTETYTSYILQRQLKGIQNLQDTYINGTLDIF
ncbi:MAG: hypothetical protein IIZ78_00125 [Clostridiales bacterium]|nr:hypothetical protein [Clostridiales bacterium]